jgi:prolyl-tRNA synthetase
VHRNRPLTGDMIYSPIMIVRLSQYLLPTLREAPSDADNVSARLMQRAGMIRKVASGIYEWLPLGLRVLKKVEAIVRSEMDGIGGQEVSLPVVQPRHLWEETGRWGVYGKELLRISDRKKAEFCFAPTAEEVITDLVRNEVRSWRQLPLMLYQVGLKFRDEIRPRFGVMRSREFLMKDAYSFHAGEDDASSYYKTIFEAYKRVFQRCGLKFRAVEAQAGAIGGSYTHEFMVLAETGEATVVSCTACDYAANLERAEIKPPEAAAGEEPKPIEEVSTPKAGSVADVAKIVGEPHSKFLKTQLYFADGKPIMALIRGDHELNEEKLAAYLGTAGIFRASEEQYVETLKSPVGFAGPQGHNGLRIVADFAIKAVANGITGSNKADLHVRNVNVGRDFQVEGYADLRSATPDDPCPRCSGKLSFMRGIEVGHTFKLGTKYSKALKATYLDKAQQPQLMVMGCYGIGVSRTVAAAIEQGNDKDGIIWPDAIAPFQVVLVSIEDDPSVKEAVDPLVKALSEKGVEVLLDDRDAKPGVKFKDADLIGIPYRLVVSPKTLKDQAVEFKARASSSVEKWPLTEAAARLTALLKL